MLQKRGDRFPEKFAVLRGGTLRQKSLTDPARFFERGGPAENEVALGARQEYLIEKLLNVIAISLRENQHESDGVGTIFLAMLIRERFFQQAQGARVVTEFVVTEGRIVEAIRELPGVASGAEIRLGIVQQVQGFVVIVQAREYGALAVEGHAFFQVVSQVDSRDDGELGEDFRQVGLGLLLAEKVHGRFAQRIDEFGSDFGRMLFQISVSPFEARAGVQTLDQGANR